MVKPLLVLTAAAALAIPSPGAETRLWTQNAPAEFEKGSLKKLSLRSDGRLRLAPMLTELYDSSTAYLWALVEDSRGNVYAAGGGPGSAAAKLFRLDANGKGSLLADLPGLAVQALAVDAGDRVYAATSPDGKVYRITPAGKPEVFFDPQAKYIWALAFHKGDLLVATGDPAAIHRVSAAGQGSVLYRSEEAHVRALVVDDAGNLIAGTEPGGLVLRVSPAGVGFVLYQAPKREITSLLVGRDGSVYAAAVGNKPPAGAAPEAPPPPPQPLPVPTGAPPPAAPGITLVQQPRGASPPALPALGAQLAGGSEVYRIDREGYPRKVWSHAQDIVYALALDVEGRPVMATGNKGNLYRLDSDLLSTVLLSAAPTQITGLLAGRQGKLYAVTGNIGKVYRIGPGLETQGTIESEVFDAGFFSYWGRARIEGHPGGAAADGSVTLATRSGNLDRPHNNWSTWAQVPMARQAGRMSSPAARFLQYRLILSGSGVGSPEVSGVELAYLPRNVAPVVEEIEITPPNYRFPPQSLMLTPSQTLTLTPMGRARRASTPTPVFDQGSHSMQYAKGHLGARWLVRDDNGDLMNYKVEIRGAQETAWKLLKDGIKDRFLSWDSTVFPDGDYRVRVTAADTPSNPPAQSLHAHLESDVFLVDNTPPGIIGFVAARAGSRLDANWRVADARSVIKKAEYSLNGGEWMVVEPTTRLSDSLEHNYNLTIDAAAGVEQTLAVRVTDEFDNQAVEKIVVR